jgi:hypothetical protein
VTYRYMNNHGNVKEGNVADLKSAALYRVVAALKVGQRDQKSLRTAGIKWIERTS